MDLHAILLEYWPHIVFVVSLAAGAGAAVHAAMTKQDVRSAIGWVGLTLLSPLFGALIYVVAGINRIRKTRLSQQRDEAMLEDAAQVETAPVDVAPISGSQFASLKVLGDQVSRFRLLGVTRSCRWPAATKPTRPCCRRSVTPATRWRCRAISSTTTPSAARWRRR